METKPLVIGIAGGSASGKTTVTQKIVERLEEKVVVLPHDSYYKDCSELIGISKKDLNFDHPDSLETTLKKEQRFKKALKRSLIHQTLKVLFKTLFLF